MVLRGGRAPAPDPGAARYAALLRSAVGRGALVVLATDQRGQCIVADGKALSMLGLGPDVVGRGLVDVLTRHPELQRLVERAIDGEPVSERARAAGRWFDVALGPAPGGGIAGVAVPADWAFPGDDALPPFAFQDPRTQLPSRQLVFDRCRMALARARRHGGNVGVLLVGVDRLGYVNETLGYEAGDRILLELGWRAVASVRPSDTVARFAGDTFAVMCDGMSHVADVGPIVQRLRDAVTAPFRVDEHEVRLTCTIGAACSQTGDGDPGALFSQAETAMKAAKANGPGQVARYEPSMGVRGDRFELEHALRQALERSELVLHYQPIVDLATERIVGLEALVRWMRPGVGLVPPGAFIPLAEETGLIAPLGAWVLRESARQFQRWAAQHVDMTSLSLSVNVSAAQLADRRLEDHVDAAIDTLEPHRLRIEITESVLMDAGVVDVLQRIHDRGVTIAVDDFGTGYSSLSYLTRLPIDALKVDRAFVAGLEDRPVDRAVAAAVVGLARALALQTVGEGVETRGQLAALRQLGCQHAQGYLFAPPLPPNELVAMLRAGGRLGAGR